MSGHIINGVKKWEHTRSILHIIYCANTADKKKKSPAEIMPLLTDPKQELVIVSAEEKQDLYELALQRANLVPFK